MSARETTHEKVVRCVCEPPTRNISLKQRESKLCQFVQNLNLSLLFLPFFIFLAWWHAVVYVPRFH